MLIEDNDEHRANLPFKIQSNKKKQLTYGRSDTLDHAVQAATTMLAENFAESDYEVRIYENDELVGRVSFTWYGEYEDV